MSRVRSNSRYALSSDPASYDRYYRSEFGRILFDFGECGLTAFYFDILLYLFRTRVVRRLRVFFLVRYFVPWFHVLFSHLDSIAALDSRRRRSLPRPKQRRGPSSNSSHWSSIQMSGSRTGVS